MVVCAHGVRVTPVRFWVARQGRKGAKSLFFSVFLLFDKNSVSNYNYG